MRKFLSQLLYFCLLIFSINFMGNFVFTNELADEDLNRKFGEVANGSYDCIFVGSSRTYRHIDPLLFDSITSTRSYNCGAASTFVPEAYYVLELLLEDLKGRKHGVETIVFEVQNMDLLDPRNAFTAKGNYWLINDYLKLATESIWQTQLPIAIKISGSMTFALGWAINHFGFNYLSIWSGSESITAAHEVRGHLCLNKQVELGIDKEPLLERGELYLDKQSVLEQRRRGWFRADSLRIAERGELSVRHLAKMRALIDQSETQGIRLLFMVPPRLKSYSSIIPLVTQLGEDRCIDLSSPVQYPGFWTTDIGFDIGHLNCRGVQLFSSELARNYLKLTGVQSDDDRTVIVQ